LFEDFLKTQSKRIYVLINNEKIWPVKARQLAYQKTAKRLGKIEIKELSSSKSSKSDYLEIKSLKKSDGLFRELLLFTIKLLLSPMKKQVCWLRIRFLLI